MRRICLAVALVAGISSLALGQADGSNTRRAGRAHVAEAERQVLATMIGGATLCCEAIQRPCGKSTRAIIGL